MLEGKWHKWQIYRPRLKFVVQMDIGLSFCFEDDAAVFEPYNTLYFKQ